MVCLYLPTIMEETQNQEQQMPAAPQMPETQSSGVSFPTIGQPKKSGGAKTLLMIGILILVGILGFVIFKSASKKSETALTEPTPFENLTQPIEGEITSATPTATPKPADKSGIKIQIQNGTGITGEAAYLQTQLKGLGYTNISVGNASAQNLTTTEVTFSGKLSSDIVNELTTKLNSIYQKVTTTTSSTSTFDAVIVTGLRKGATPKASATSSATPTPTPTPTATPTH